MRQLIILKGQKVAAKTIHEEIVSDHNQAVFVKMKMMVKCHQDVPFHQPQLLQCLHHGLPKTYLCSPLCSIPFSTAM